MIIATGTNIGKVREINEDSFKSVKLGENMYCLIIADGMGGHRAGQVASATTCTIVAQCVNDFLKDNGIDDGNAEICLENAINIANKKLFSDQMTDDSLSGMGTTVVVALITDKTIHVCNAGDSRLYVVEDKLRQITKDHSYVQDLLDKGLITGEEAENHPNKNIITRAVGTELNISIDYFEVDKSMVSKIIMCTDGLTNFVSDDEIYEIVMNNEAEEANKTLIDLANKNGGRDNITVINVDFEGVR